LHDGIALLVEKGAAALALRVERAARAVGDDRALAKARPRDLDQVRALLVGEEPGTSRIAYCDRAPQTRNPRTPPTSATSLATATSPISTCASWSLCEQRKRPQAARSEAKPRRSPSR
jgi:hypothetical protein